MPAMLLLGLAALAVLALVLLLGTFQIVAKAVPTLVTAAQEIGVNTAPDPPVLWIRCSDGILINVGQARALAPIGPVLRNIDGQMVPLYAAQIHWTAQTAIDDEAKNVIEWFATPEAARAWTDALAAVLAAVDVHHLVVAT